MTSKLSKISARIGYVLALSAVLGSAAPAAGQDGAGQESAWEERLRRDPRAADSAALDSLTRRVLHKITPEQAAALAAGTPPEEIVLAGGGTLAQFLARSVTLGAGLVYEPVDQCKLFATRTQTAPVTGPMAADEVREYIVRGAHPDQGGSATCLVPDEAVAAVMHFRVVADAVEGDRGFLRVWAADAPEPSTPVVDYEPVVDLPLTPRLRFNGTAVVELCPLAGCGGVDIKVKTMRLGAHVRGDVVGFFRPTVAADVPEAGNAQTLGGMDKSTFADAVHTHDGGDIVSGTVGEPFIDPLIARDAEVLPIVLANDGPGSGLDADLVDGKDSTDLMLQVGNCLQVSPNCPAGAAEALDLLCWQTVNDALAAIGTDLPAATAANPYLVKVGPGDYNGFVTKEFVTVEGSGQKVTTITAQDIGDGVAVFAVANSELRHLTVRNQFTNPGEVNSALLGFAGITLRRVTLLASGGEPNRALILSDAGAVLEHVTLVALGTPGGAVDSALFLGFGASATVRDSTLDGADDAATLSAGATVEIVNTQLVGTASGGTYTCLGAFDDAFTELGTDCQPQP